MERNLILIAGIPGTGKTTIGNFLEKSYGYLHVDMEENHRTSEILADIDAFTKKHFSGNKDVVVTWGFSPDQDTIDVVNKLCTFGFKIFWFDGNRDSAHKATMNRAGFDEKVLQQQMNYLAEWDIPKKIKAKIIDVFNDKGNFRDLADITNELLQGFVVTRRDLGN